MGRAAAIKQQKIEEKEQAFKAQLALISRQNDEAKKQPPAPLLSLEFYNEYGGRFVRKSEAFVDRLKSSSPDRKRKELIKHLFNKYPVPEFIYQAANWDFDNYGSFARQPTQVRGVASYHYKDIREWYICVGTGGSFYKEIAKEFFTKKEAHLFLNCPFKISLQEAIVYAVAKAEGAEDGQALRISKSKLHRERLTQFVKETIRWFVVNPPESYHVIDDYFDYLRDRRNQNPQFSLMGSGYSIESLKAKVEQWHRDLARLKVIQKAAWDGVPLADSVYEEEHHQLGHIRWFFTQLLNSSDLQAEGNAQRHCVASYVGNCSKGYTSIWSMRMGYSTDTFKTATRKLTIEMRADGSIVQARGVGNRQPKPIEWAILRKWAKDNMLRMSC